MVRAAGTPAVIKPLSTTTTRVIDAHAEILGQEEPDNLAFLHTVLAQCGLPYRDPGERDYIRENGRSSLIISAGHLLDPKTRKPTLQGIPYGAKPRLLMIHLCTEAVRTKTPTIEIGQSMSAFMKQLGLQVTGGEKGTIARFKEQLNRLASSRLQLIMNFGDTATVMNPAPIIRQFDVWFPSDANQRTLWPSHVTLSTEFFDTLTKHALPLDPRGIRALQHSARAIDCYTWLAHRLPRVKSRTGDRVSWAALQTQFGPDMAEVRMFKRHMLVALRQVLAVYPKARVEQVDGGLLLHRSDPPIAYVPKPRLPR
jgi:hypothetical protein